MPNELKQLREMRKQIPEEPVDYSGVAGLGASVPKAVRAIYDQHFREHKLAGKDDTAAHAHGARMLRHAGWYKTSTGWKQLSPDVRKKVNVREAIKQPGGRYVIEGVDLFHPNAIKGKQLAFGPAENAELIENTQRAIVNGGQKPAIVEGHTSDEQKMLGIQLDAQGSGIGFRESPRGKGWIRCDLVDVPQEMKDRLVDLKLPGLSVKIIKDPTGNNPRIGHIALLGGSMQALSHLPGLEVFSAEASNGGQLCFSADPPGEHIMGPKIKDCHAAYASAYAAYEAAEESSKLGEPGSVEKLRNAGQKLASALKALSGECSEGDYEAEAGAGGEPDAPLATAATGAGAMPTDQGPMDSVPQAYDSDIDDALDFACNEANIMNDPKQVFLNLANIARRERNEKKVLSANVGKLTKMMEGMAGKMFRNEFSADIDDVGKTHVLPPKDIIEMNFAACLESKDPIAAKLRFLKTLRAGQKKQNPADQPTIFSAEDHPEGGVDFSSDSQIGASLERLKALGIANPNNDDRAVGRAVSGNGKANPNILR